MFQFENLFTGESFRGTINELFFLLEGKHESLFNKADVIKSYGWSFNENKIIL